MNANFLGFIKVDFWIFCWKGFLLIGAFVALKITKNNSTKLYIYFVNLPAFNHAT